MDDLLEMKEDVEKGEEFVSVSPAQLASRIIFRYRKTGYKREKEAIKKKFFDHRRHLESSLKNAKSEDELRDVLIRASKKLGNVRKKERGVNDENF